METDGKGGVGMVKGEVLDSVNGPWGAGSRILRAEAVYKEDVGC